MPKILIVDDDSSITELMKTMVAMEGFEPTIVNDSTMALEAAQLTNPDIITLDLMMPKLSGYELCLLLRKNQKFVNVPIVIISAKTDPASMKQAMDAGASEYITKPFRVEYFIDLIKSLLNTVT